METEATHDQKSWCNAVCSELWFTTAFREHFSLSAPLAATSDSCTPNIMLSNFPGSDNVLAVVLDFSGTPSWHELSQRQSGIIQYSQAHRFPPFVL